MKNIHVNFKRYLSRIPHNFKEYFTNTEDNDTIINDLLKLFQEESLTLCSLAVEWWEDIYVKDIKDIVGIDRTYLRTSTGLIYYRDFFATILKERETFDQPFSIDSIVEVIWPMLQRRKGVWGYEGTAGRRLQVKWYSALNKYVELIDYNNSEYKIPQVILVKKRFKSLKWEYEKELRRGILKEYKIAKENNLARVGDQLKHHTEGYIDYFKKFKAINTEDEAAAVENIIKLRVSLKENLENHAQIDKSSIELTDSHLNFKTNFLYISINWEDKILWKFKVNLNMKNWRLIIRAITTKSFEDSQHQHPHINRNGDCCLGSFTNPLKEAYADQNYILVVEGILQFLQSYYASSVYIEYIDYAERYFTPEEIKANKPTEEIVPPERTEEELKKELAKDPAQWLVAQSGREVYTSNESEYPTDQYFLTAWSDQENTTSITYPVADAQVGEDYTVVPVRNVAGFLMYDINKSQIYTCSRYIHPTKRLTTVRKTLSWGGEHATEIIREYAKTSTGTIIHIWDQPLYLYS